MAFNTVILSGRLTADPELKTTQSGLSVTSFTIAVDRRVKSGEEKKADFITIVAWRNTAELITKHFRKGNMIGIEGSIQTRKYTDKDGNNRTAFEVVANNIQFLESKKNGSTSNEPDPLQTVADNLGNYTDDFPDISGEDLPF